MWYKYNESADEWLSGNEIHFPDGTILKDNHSIQEDGWFWSERPPEGFGDSEFSVNS